MEYCLVVKMADNTKRTYHIYANSSALAMSKAEDICLGNRWWNNEVLEINLCHLQLISSVVR